MKNKIYKGVIHSLLPQKGFGFITPVWSSGDSEENIFFHLSETKGGKCFIPALASAENRKEVVSKKGTKTYVPTEQQVVFFELETQELPNGVRLIAKKIKDSKNVSDEDAEEADANTAKPSAEELLHPTEEKVDLAVTPETIQQTEPADRPDSCEAMAEDNDSLVQENLEEEDEYEDEDEEEVEEDYDEEYEEYQDFYDRQAAKSSRRYSPKENKDR